MTKDEGVAVTEGKVSKGGVDTGPSAPRPAADLMGQGGTQAKSAEDHLRAALRAMLDNTPPDATPRSVRAEAEAAVKE
ncbi:MAG: hypothetical protein ABIL09_16085 [Gemmatimonadota bacterium]